MPRHPSCALSSLTTKKQINFVLQSLNISCLSNCKLLCNPSSCRLLTNLFFSCQSTPQSLADFSLNNQVNLYLRVKLVGVLGFEPRTSSLSGTRSNQLSYTPAGSTRWQVVGCRQLMLPLEPPCCSGESISFSGFTDHILVEPKGLEPSTSCLQSRCSSQLSYGPLFTLIFNQPRVSPMVIEL